MSWELESSSLIAIALLWAGLLGYATWTDIRRDRTIKNVASLSMLASAFAIFPFLYEDTLNHIFWATGWSVFLFIGWWLGAWADGDLKIYLAYAWLFGQEALFISLISWILIIIYSIPTIKKSLKKKDLPKGHRLGTAPGAPGIALALPIGAFFLGADAVVALIWTGVYVGFIFLSEIIARVDKKLVS